MEGEPPFATRAAVCEPSSDALLISKLAISCVDASGSCGWSSEGCEEVAGTSFVEAESEAWGCKVAIASFSAS